MHEKHIEHILLPRPVILILDAPPVPGPDSAIESAVLADAGINAEIITVPASGSDSHSAFRIPPSALERADFILTWRTPVDASLIERARRCLVIIHYGPGAGRGVARVDLEAARQAGIYVASVPDYATASWAEAAFSLIHRLTRDASILPPRPLAGLRLGLVGFGQVGRRVAQAAIEQKMDVWACDPFAPDEPFLTSGVRRCDLATLCGVSDIVSLHLPLGPATRGLINADALLMMKHNSLLINSSAPELVDFDALDAALERGRPWAAAFDEDLAGLLPPAHPLLAHPRMIHGPRQAGSRPADAEACRRRVGELILHVLRGNRPGHLLIDPPCPRHIVLLARQ